MLTSSGSYIHINNIIYQPTNECENKCHNCYIKSSNPTKPNTGVWIELIELIATRKLTCWTFTLSLNKFRYRAFSPFPQLPQELIKTLFEAGIHIYITAKTVDDIKQWISLQDLKYITGVSLATILPTDIRRDARLLEDYNPTLEMKFSYVVKETTELQRLHLPQYTNASRYLILEKAPLGELIPRQNIERYIKQEQMTYPHYPDTCVSELRKHGACSAGRSRVHIWPDGSVTACQYDSNRHCAQNSSTLLKSIVEVIDQPQPTNICSLWSQYHDKS
jgi:hypothetical protein